MKHIQNDLDVIQRAAFRLNKEGYNVQDIFDCIRFLNRQIIIESAKTIHDLPEIEIHKIGRSPVKFDPALWEKQNTFMGGKP